MKYFLLLSLLSFSAVAADNDLTHRPKGFAYETGSAQFVDLTAATYKINYDLDAATASVEAKLKLNMIEEGYPLIDLVEAPQSVTLNGKKVETAVISTPSAETTVRVIQKKIKPGSYELVIKVPLKNLIQFTESGVKSAFWVTDLEDRFYLERYIPVNFEYDRVKMRFEVSFKGLKNKQHVFANGKVSWKNDSTAIIDYPDYYTVNSLYYHTTPVGGLEMVETTYLSVDSRVLPITIYMAKDGAYPTTQLESFKTTTLQVLAELEGDYGAFPHNQVVIYGASLRDMGLGGMEYAGATVTNLPSLGHELFHSYFARGVAPANGNAGWIDEALASWRDDGYLRLPTMTGTSRMAAHPYYTRKTDTMAYSYGANFMAYLDNKFALKGGLKPFMQKLLEKRIFKPMFTEEFISDMESFYGEDLKSIFKTHVYGIGAPEEKSLKFERHPIHQKMGPKELKSLL